MTPASDVADAAAAADDDADDADDERRCELVCVQGVRSW